MTFISPALLSQEVYRYCFDLFFVLSFCFFSVVPDGEGEELAEVGSIESIELAGRRGGRRLHEICVRVCRLRDKILASSLVDSVRACSPLAFLEVLRPPAKPPNSPMTAEHGLDDIQFTPANKKITRKIYCRQVAF